MHVNAKASTHLLQIPSAFLCKFDWQIFLKKKVSKIAYLNYYFFFKNKEGI